MFLRRVLPFSSNKDCLIIWIAKRMAQRTQRSMLIKTEHEHKLKCTVDSCKSATRQVQKMEFTSVNAHIQCLHRTSLCNEQFLLVRSMAARPGFDPLQEKRTFLLAYASIQSPIERVPGVVTPGVKGGRGVILTIHLNVVSRSRTNMATPLSDECLHGVQRNSSYFQTFATTTTTPTYRQSWLLWRIF